MSVIKKNSSLLYYHSECKICMKLSIVKNADTYIFIAGEYTPTHLTLNHLLCFFCNKFSKIYCGLQKIFIAKWQIVIIPQWNFRISLFVCLICSVLRHGDVRNVQEKIFLLFIPSRYFTRNPVHHFPNVFQFLNLWALQISHLNKIHIFKCTGNIFTVKFQMIYFEILHK